MNLSKILKPMQKKENNIGKDLIDIEVSKLIDAEIPFMNPLSFNQLNDELPM